MEIYKVGPDEAYDEPSNNIDYKWLVYWYEVRDYCGDGQAVALGVDGRLYYYDLSHCSCYGPFDEFGKNRASISVQDYLNATSVYENWSEEIRVKVKELLGASQ